MCERRGFRRGFSVDWPRHKIEFEDYKKVQGPNRKTTLSSTSILPGTDVQEVRSSSAPGALVADDEGGLGSNRGSERKEEVEGIS
jgi:hypothetical protein